jgi:hypothetical protein
MNGLMFVHDKHILAFNQTETAFDFYSSRLQVLLGNRDLHAFSQIHELLIQLIGFHFLSSRQALKIAAYVLLLTDR